MYSIPQIRVKTNREFVMEIRKSSVYYFNGIYNNYVIIRQTFKFLIENLPGF